MAKLNWTKNEWGGCWTNSGEEKYVGCQELIVEEMPGFRKPLYHKHVDTNGVSVFGSYHTTLVGVFKTDEEADEAILATIRAKIAGLNKMIKMISE